MRHLPVKVSLWRLCVVEVVVIWIVIWWGSTGVMLRQHPLKRMVVVDANELSRIMGRIVTCCDCGKGIWNGSSWRTRTCATYCAVYLMAKSRIMTLGDHDPVAFRRAAIPDLIFLQLNVRVLCIVSRSEVLMLGCGSLLSLECICICCHATGM